MRPQKDSVTPKPIRIDTESILEALTAARAPLTPAEPAERLSISADDRCSFNAELDGQAGIQELAGNATLLYYLSEEAKEGKNSFLEKREPDFSKFPKFP